MEDIEHVRYEEESAKLMKKGNELWGAKFVEDFPGPQPISIERKHMHKLYEDDYLVGDKNDGIRVALYIFKENSKYYCLLMDRKMKMYRIKMKISRVMYEGTIIDCELMKDKLIILDVIMIAGVNMKQKTFSERLNEVDTFIDSIKDSYYKISKKQFVLLNDIESLLGNSEDETDGLIFMPNNHSIQQKTHTNMFKWKPKKQNTVDFYIKGKKSMLQNAGNLVWVRINMDLSNIDDDCQDKVIECECTDISTKSWKGLFIRTDKTLPNSKYTYERTLVNIQEDIQISEFFTK